MNKQEIVQQIAEYAHLSKADAAAALDGFVHTVSDALAKHSRVHINGFGTFEVDDTAALKAKGRGGDVTVGFVPDQLPAFKAGGKLRSRMPSSPRGVVRPVAYQNDNYMAVLIALRNMTGFENVTDLSLPENRVVVREAAGKLPAGSFSLQQWRVAARYLIGGKTSFTCREQVVNFLLDEL